MRQKLKLVKKPADVLRRNFYADDCLRSEESDKKAIERVHDIIHACKEGGFHLTKISSNSRRVLETIPEDERSKEVKGIDLSFDNLPVERALGVQWHIESDVFGFKITLKDMPYTRRGILSTISSVYDPLGFAAPVLLPAKRILQELCKSDTDWDDPISEEYSHQWERWRIKLPTLETFTTERCLKPANFGLIINRQVHSFSDASSTGYGQVTYLRQVNSNGEIHCAFLMGKARLAPIKSVTIPRLELTAAVVSSKIGNKIVEELDLNVEKPTYWTDSTTVIRYIVNEQNRYQTYVANRVQTIRDKTDPDQWRFVPGKDNPADDASRGLEIESLNRQHRWISGPDFLWKPENEWPVLTIDMDESIQNDPEVKTSTVHSAIMEEKSTILERFKYFSQWQRLKRVIAWLLRLRPKNVDHTTAQVNKEQRQSPTPRPITVKETEKAETVIIKIVQEVSFPMEIATLKAIRQEQFCNTRSMLKKKNTELKRTSSLYKLDPVIDEDGLIRVGGRLSNSDDFTEDFKHPVILPRKCHVTTLIVRHAHEKVAHGGRGVTLSELRAKYWIVNANSAVRSYITKCVKCRSTANLKDDQKTQCRGTTSLNKRCLESYAR
ncbi:hypothetical protein QZH41_004056 [Actinostola sp. cb2023]|nr:hypothetical protein QZH41_004056 [Actinostola sp. cb2023]